MFGTWTTTISLLVPVFVAACETATLVPEEPQEAPALAHATAMPSSGDTGILAYFYQVAGGENWRNKQGWLTDAPLRDWYGVSVDDEGRVTELTLSYNGLVGTIPKELASLGSMEQLNLEGNALTGPIPPEFGDLADLTNLALGQNQLSGAIPAELGNLSSLKTLSLGNNYLSGPIPEELGLLSTLTGMGLSNNALTGTVPPELGELEDLLGLYLDGNDLTGTLPRSFRALTNLHSLRIRGTDLCVPGTRSLRWLLDIPANDVVLCNAVDEAVMESLYHATDGANWAHSYTPGSGVEDFPGATVDSIGHITELELTGKGLNGRLPSGLGRLTQLNTLRVGQNLLLGPLPLALTKLSLNEFKYVSTGLCYPDSPQFRAWLDAIPSHEGTGYRCPPQSDRDILGMFFTATNGRRWRGRARENWLTDAPLEEWFGVSVDGEGRVTRLVLNDVKLAGSIPAELGQLDALIDLDLSNIHYGPGIIGNELTGSIPTELGELGNLNRLALSNNPKMAGALPEELTHLGRLDVIAADNTGLCAPTTDTFNAWLEGMATSRIAACDPPMVYLTQGVQSQTFPVPLVAGRKAMLRVFLTAKRKSNHFIPPIRARFYRYGRLTHTVTIPSKTGPIPAVVDPRRLSLTANAEIPAHVIQPGLELVIDVDVPRTFDPTLGVPSRIPADAGRLAIDVRAVPTFDLTLVPFLRRANPDSAIVEMVRAVARDPENHEMLSDALALLPIGEVSVSAHEPVFTSSSHPVDLLGETGVLRALEGGTGHYMGMMEADGPGGLSWMSGRVSFAQPDPAIVAHELGHNLSLRHAPCGLAPYPDASFPHGGGTIGVWGYDFRGGGRVVSPRIPDIMSWCDPAWISDYHFRKALLFRHRRVADGSLATAPAESLLLWGGVDADGQPHLEPSFFVEASAAMPSHGGEWQLAGQSNRGRNLFTLPFDMPETADGDGSSSFAFVVPAGAGWRDALASVTISGPSGSFTLDRDTDTPMVILRDLETGRVRGILRDVPERLAGSAWGVALSRTSSVRALFSRGIPEPGVRGRW